MLSFVVAGVSKLYSSMLEDAGEEGIVNLWSIFLKKIPVLRMLGAFCPKVRSQIEGKP